MTKITRLSWIQRRIQPGHISFIFFFGPFRITIRTTFLSANVSCSFLQFSQVMALPVDTTNDKPCTTTRILQQTVTVVRLIWDRLGWSPRCRKSGILKCIHINMPSYLICLVLQSGPTHVNEMDQRGPEFCSGAPKTTDSTGNFKAWFTRSIFM